MSAGEIVSNLVSVILPVFNRPDYLPEAVNQVLAQTYRPLELILVDDGSTDATEELCDKIAGEHPEMVRVLHRENGGPGAARESGRLLARGEFLQYFDSDDQIHPRKIVVQVAALRDHPDCGIAYCQTHEFNRGEEPDERCSQFTGEDLKYLFPRLLAGCCWPTITPLIRRSVSDAVGPWLPLRQEEDWEYDSRIAAMGVRLVYCHEFLASAVNHSGPRASGTGLGDAEKLRDRCRARSEILENALKAGVSEDDPNRIHFAKAAFLLARQCGAVGLAQESQELLAISCRAAGKGRTTKQDLYRLLARGLGWKRMGTLCAILDGTYFKR